MNEISNIYGIESEEMLIVTELINSIDHLWNSHDYYGETLDYIIKGIDTLPEKFKIPFARFYIREILDHLKILRELLSETREAKRFLFKLIDDDKNSDL